MTPRHRSPSPEAFQAIIGLFTWPFSLCIFLLCQTGISKENKHVKENKVHVIHTSLTSRSNHSRALHSAGFLTFVCSHNRWRNCRFGGATIIVISSYLRPRISVSISGKHEMRCVRSTILRHYDTTFTFLFVCFLSLCHSCCTDTPIDELGD